MTWFSQSREARYSERGRPQTTRAAAMRVANNSLTARRVPPHPLTTDQQREHAAKLLYT